MSVPFSDVNLNNIKKDVRTNASNILVSEQALSDMNSVVVGNTNSITSLNSAVVKLSETQNITGAKTFTTRAKSITPVADDDLVIKEYVDKFNKFHYKQSTAFVEQSITSGNPSDTNPNQKGGLFTELSISGVNGNADAVSLEFSIVGEWSSFEYDKGVIIAKYQADTINGTYTANTTLKGASNGSGVRFIQNFNLSHNVNDHGSTMESCNGKFIDTANISGKFYKYEIVCVNSSGATADFFLNRTQATGVAQRESGVSVITAQEFYV